jgi:hypothetical protein
MTKFCKDCANFMGGDICSRPTGRLDRVTGEELIINYSAREERHPFNPGVRENECGKEARYFVPKAPQVQLLTETRPEMTDDLGKWRTPNWWV